MGTPAPGGVVLIGRRVSLRGLSATAAPAADRRVSGRATICALSHFERGAHDALSVAIALTVSGRAQQPATAPSDTSPQVLDAQGGRIRVVTVATGLFHPWSFAFLPDGSMLVAERNGRLRVIRNGTLAPDPVWTSPTPAGQGGDALHSVAVHPQFATNNLVYLSYPKQGERGSTLAIVRGRFTGSALDEV